MSNRIHYPKKHHMFRNQPYINNNSTCLKTQEFSFQSNKRLPELADLKCGTNISGEIISEDFPVLMHEAAFDNNTNQEFSVKKLAFIDPSSLNGKEQIHIFEKYAKNIFEFAIAKENINPSNKISYMASQKAFQIFINGPLSIAQALIKDNFFFVQVTKILNDNENGQKIIGKIAAILNRLVLSHQQLAIESIGFIPFFLKYIQESEVFDLFHTIFTNEENLKPVLEMMAVTALDIFIINEITDDMNEMKLYNILQILKDCLECETLAYIFQNMNVMEKLESLLNRYYNNTFLLNQIWRVFSLLVCEKLLLKMKSIFEEAIDTICQSFERLESYHIFIFDFLARVVDIKPVIFTENQKKQLLQTIKSLFVKFPNSTHLINSMLNFIRKSLHNRDFAQRVLSGFIDFFIDEGTKKQRTAASASALSFLSDITYMKKSSIMINKHLTNNKKYSSFYKSFFKKYLEDIQSPYGGLLGRYVSDGKKY